MFVDCKMIACLLWQYLSKVSKAPLTEVPETLCLGSMAVAESPEVEALRETVRQLSSQASHDQGYSCRSAFLQVSTFVISCSVQVARLKQELGALHGTEAVALRYLLFGKLALASSFGREFSRNMKCFAGVLTRVLPSM